MKWGSTRGVVAITVEEIRRLKPLDWFFVFSTYLTVGYLIFNLLETRNPDASFDFLPIMVGIAVIPMGWRGVRLAEELKAALQNLQAGAGLEMRDEALDTMMADFRKQRGRWSWGFGVLIMFLCFAGFSYIVGGHLLDPDIDPKTLGELVLLGLVMAGGGLLVGWLLGSLIGYGRLFSIMDKHQVRFASTATKAAQNAMRSVEEAFEYAFQASGALCLWFAAWWIAWQLRLPAFDDYREQYQSFFVVLWAVSVFLLITTAWFPARLLNRRLDTLQGGPEAKTATNEQIKLAEQDLEALADRSSLEAEELQALIQTLKSRQQRSPWLNNRLLDAAVLANVPLYLLPRLFGKG